MRVHMCVCVCAREDVRVARCVCSCLHALFCSARSHTCQHFGFPKLVSPSAMFLALASICTCIGFPKSDLRIVSTIAMSRSSETSPALPRSSEACPHTRIAVTSPWSIFQAKQLATSLMCHTAVVAEATFQRPLWFERFATFDKTPTTRWCPSFGALDAASHDDSDLGTS